MKEQQIISRKAAKAPLPAAWSVEELDARLLSERPQRS
jgi:hypothetical protein